MVFSWTLAFLPEPWNRVERIRQKKTLPLSWEGKKLWIEFKRGEIAKKPEDRKNGTKRGVFEAVNANNTGGDIYTVLAASPQAGLIHWHSWNDIHEIKIE